MKFILDIDIADNKADFVKEFFKTISFVKKVRPMAPNEITNPLILHSIEMYESRNNPSKVKKGIALSQKRKNAK